MSGVVQQVVNQYRHFSGVQSLITLHSGFVLCIETAGIALFSAAEDLGDLTKVCSHLALPYHHRLKSESQSFVLSWQQQKGQDFITLVNGVFIRLSHSDIEFYGCCSDYTHGERPLASMPLVPLLTQSVA